MNRVFGRSSARDNLPLLARESSDDDLLSLGKDESFATAPTSSSSTNHPPEPAEFQDYELCGAFNDRHRSDEKQNQRHAFFAELPSKSSPKSGESSQHKRQMRRRRSTPEKLGDGTSLLGSAASRIGELPLSSASSHMPSADTSAPLGAGAYVRDARGHWVRNPNRTMSLRDLASHPSHVGEPTTKENWRKKVDAESKQVTERKIVSHPSQRGGELTTQEMPDAAVRISKQASARKLELKQTSERSLVSKQLSERNLAAKALSERSLLAKKESSAERKSRRSSKHGKKEKSTREFDRSQSNKDLLEALPQEPVVPLPSRQTMKSLSAFDNSMNGSFQFVEAGVSTKGGDDEDFEAAYVQFTLSPIKKRAQFTATGASAFGSTGASAFGAPMSPTPQAPASPRSSKAKAPRRNSTESPRSPSGRKKRVSLDESKHKKKSTSNVMDEGSKHNKKKSSNGLDGASKHKRRSSKKSSRSAAAEGAAAGDNVPEQEHAFSAFTSPTSSPTKTASQRPLKEASPRSVVDEVVAEPNAARMPPPATPTRDDSPSKRRLLSGSTKQASSRRGQAPDRLASFLTPNRGRPSRRGTHFSLDDDDDNDSQAVDAADLNPSGGGLVAAPNL